MNHDDKVTMAEYLKEMYDLDAEDGKISFEDIQDLEQSKLLKDDQALFAQADANQDDSLTREEFVMFNSPEEFPQMLPLILNQTLSEKDKNGDGKINFQEFVGESARDHDKNWLMSEKDRFDNEFDKDNDGSLNGNEILSWIVPSNE